MRNAATFGGYSAYKFLKSQRDAASKAARATERAQDRALAAQAAERKRDEALAPAEAQENDLSQATELASKRKRGVASTFLNNTLG